MTRGSHRAWHTKRSMAVLGTGAALPGDAIPTPALLAIMADRFGFQGARGAQAIADRMGIASRHIARAFQDRHENAMPCRSNPELAAQAILAALDDAGLAVDDIGYLIAHTTTPVQLLPGNVAMVADLIGYDGPHIELRQACTGFANALMIADGLIAADPDRPVVIVGSETGSLFLDPAALATDNGQVVNMLQMGDGAAAIVLAGTATARAMIEAAWYGATGRNRAPGIRLDQGARHFEHDFAGIRATGHTLFEAGRDMAAALDLPIEQADWIIPHQVSGKIGALVADHFGIDRARTFVNADRLGNTGSAAIWLALHDIRRNVARPGDRAVVLGAEASKYMFGGFAYVHG